MLKFASDTRSVVRPADYGKWKSLPKSILAFPSITSDDIQGWKKKVSIIIKAQTCLSLPLEYVKPSEDDEEFLVAFNSTLDNGGETDETRALAKKFAKITTLWTSADNIIKAKLLDAAGTNATITRLITKMSDEDSCIIIEQLLKDYDKTSSATAFSLKSELQMIDVKTTMHEYISEVEAKIEEIQSAGGNVDMAEIAELLLNKGMLSARYQTHVSTKMALLETKRKKPVWSIIRSWALQLDAKTKSVTATEPSTTLATTTVPHQAQVALATSTTNGKKLCKTCGKVHAGKCRLLTQKNNVSQIAAAIATVLKGDGKKPDQRRFQNRGSYQARGNIGRGNIGNGNFGHGNFGRGNNQQDIFPGNCHSCGVYGHKSYQCPNKGNDRQQYRRTVQDAGFDNAALATEYGALLKKIKPDCFACFDDYACFIGLDTKDDDIILIDSAASRIFVFASKRLMNPRKVSHSINTASTADQLQTFMQGEVGIMTCFAMNKKLQCQLCGTAPLTDIGYSILIVKDGLFLKYPGREDIWIARVANVYPAKMSQIPEFSMNKVGGKRTTDSDSY